MFGKRLAVARLIQAVRADRILARNLPASLLIFNYHRLRPTDRSWTTAFDDGVFGPDTETFHQQMMWLQSVTQVLDEEGLLELAGKEEIPRGTIYSAVTFDDGYSDCYTLAKPILDQLGIHGIFFIPVGMLESRELGWWDIAAYLLKNSRQRTIVVDGREYDLQNRFSESLHQVLTQFKLQKAEHTAALLQKLTAACGIPLPSTDLQSRELMSWDQVRALRNDGHAIGSHSVSHRVLATLDPGAQAAEIVNSRRMLQTIVGCNVNSFAYPVGGPQHLDHHSVSLAREAGYSLAFTFNTGMASLPIGDRYQIPREAANSLAVLKAKIALPRVMGLREIRAV